MQRNGRTVIPCARYPRGAAQSASADQFRLLGLLFIALRNELVLLGLFLIALGNDVGLFLVLLLVRLRVCAQSRESECARNRERHDRLVGHVSTPFQKLMNVGLPPTRI